MAEIRGGMGEVLLDTKKFNGVLLQSVSSAAMKKEATEEDEENTEDSSPSDYECSLREENIRLKSRLEKAKEGGISWEKQYKKAQEDLEREKKFGNEANNTIHTLMQEKQQLLEQLQSSASNAAASPKSVLLNTTHTEGIQEVVQKLENEIHVLEARLDSQRKRYHQEHLVMYEDLKEERNRRQEWKQTYLKSQVAVMTFRRKLFAMKDRVSEQDIKELSKCLELVFHEPDGHIKEDLLSKKGESGDVGNSKYAALINSTYIKSKDSSSSTSGNTGSATNLHTAADEGLHILVNDAPYKAQQMLPDEPVQPKPPGSTIKLSLSGSGDDSISPKVYIMDELNELHDPSVIMEEKLKSKDKGKDTMSPSSQTPHYELSGSKHHDHSASAQQKQEQLMGADSTTQYKHWHHYSIDNPGHTQGRRLEGLLAAKTGQVLAATSLDNNNNTSSSKNNNSSNSSSENRNNKSQFSQKYANDNLELNANDTKFLELTFNKNFVKTDTAATTVPAKLLKLNEQKNSSRTTTNSNNVNGAAASSPSKSTEKKLYCLTCDKDIVDRSCGHTTIIVQEKEKEFPCPTCGRVFMNRSHLKRHNMIHSGEKPFACTYCDKRFNRKSHLSRHLLTHTGEKPFKCPTCDKGFADNSDLKRHKQTHELSSELVPILPKEDTGGSSISTTNSAVSPIGSGVVNPMNVLTSVSAVTMVAVTSINNSVTGIILSPTQSTTLSIPKLAPTVPKVPIPRGRPPGSGKNKDDRYACNKCTKTFARKSHLTRHKLTHDQVKIYCDCGRLFRQNAQFQAHYPACKRKRDDIEAKYLANGKQRGPGEAKPSPSTATTSAGTLYSLLVAADASNSTSDIKMVGDFQSQLSAKSGGGGGSDGHKGKYVNMEEEEEEYEAQEINFTEDDEEFDEDDTISSDVVSPREPLLTTPPEHNSSSSSSNNSITDNNTGAISISINNRGTHNNNISDNKNSPMQQHYTSSETSTDLLQQCMALTEKLVGEQKQQAAGVRTTSEILSPKQFPSLGNPTFGEQLFLVPPEALGSSASTTPTTTTTSSYLPSASLQQKFAAFAEMNCEGSNNTGSVGSQLSDINYNVIMKNGNGKHAELQPF